MRRQKWRSSYSAEPTEYLQLTAGDIVVHFHHGIGKFIGIESLPNHEGEPTEFLQLEYAEKGKLYVKGKDYIVEDGDMLDIRFNV